MNVRFNHITVGVQNPVVVSGLLVHYDPVKNVTLNYTITQPIPYHHRVSGGPEYVKPVPRTVEMKYPSHNIFEHPNSQTYEATIPVFPGRNIVWFYITASDYKGNTVYSSPIQKTFHYDVGTIKRLIQNRINITTSISNLDVNNLTANDVSFLYSILYLLTNVIFGSSGRQAQ